MLEKLKKEVYEANYGTAPQGPDHLHLGKCQRNGPGNRIFRHQTQWCGLWTV